MTLNEYQELAMRTKAVGQSKEDQLHNAGHGISGEVGEVIKELCDDARSVSVLLHKELGDVMWYLAQLADALAFKLEDVTKDEPLSEYMKDIHPAIMSNYTVEDILIANLAICAGEINELIKKAMHHGKTQAATQFYKPMKGVLRCVSTAAAWSETTLEAVLEQNIEKLKERWPDGFKVGKA